MLSVNRQYQARGPLWCAAAVLKPCFHLCVCSSYNLNYALMMQKLSNQAGFKYPVVGSCLLHEKYLLVSH